MDEIGSLETLYYLSRYNCFEVDYLKAKYYISIKDLAKAKIFIDKAIENHSAQMSFSSLNIIDPIGSILLNQVNESQLFGLAGTIYAKLSSPQYESSLDYFKQYFFHLQNKIHSELKDRESVILYSFRTPSEYSISDIANNTLNLARPTEMNDPFDSIAYIWKEFDHLKEIVSDPSHLSIFVKAFDYFRIRSFMTSSNVDLRYKEDDTLLEDILMWSHYAESHKGMCVKYCLTPDFFSFRTDNASTYHYRELRPINYVLEDKLVTDIKSIETQRAFFQKSAFWKKENEVRLLSYNTQIDGPYLQEPLDNGARIEEIIFGISSTPSFRHSIINSAKGKGIIFSYMDIEKYDNVYKLIKRPL